MSRRTSERTHIRAAHRRRNIGLEIPLGKRTPSYRFFEMLPGLISYTMIILLVVLSLVSPILASVYLLLVIISLFVKAVGISVHTVRGRGVLERAQRVDWHERLAQLEDPTVNYERESGIKNNGFGHSAHKENLRILSEAAHNYPKPSQIYNAVIVAAYNESYEVLGPTIQSVANTHYDSRKLIIFLAYEQRGGLQMKQTAEQLKQEYSGKFFGFEIIEHPSDMKGEVIGKGGNITYAGFQLEAWLKTKQINNEDVIVTTLDSDNRPHSTYFDYVTYEYIVHPDRHRTSFQPVSLFLNNIWDVPAPMRVVATGNSFWNIIVSQRPHLLRNFASHSQPMSALAAMNFWSTRTIVEDGHQYWRSYFYFKGNYSVTPIHVPIYQDAVLSDTYRRTLKAQFIQLRRWAYGASDIPYVATRIFTHHRDVPFINSVAHLVRLIDGHVTLAVVAILVAVGGWVPLLLNSDASRDIAAHQLPVIISNVQRVATIGIIITIFFALKMLPPRPARYKRRRTLGMVLQWLLMPVTAIGYSAMAAFNAQTHLLFGKYLDKFDVTEKATAASVERAKRQKKAGRGDVDS